MRLPCLPCCTTYFAVLDAKSCPYLQKCIPSTPEADQGTIFVDDDVPAHLDSSVLRIKGKAMANIVEISERTVSKYNTKCHFDRYYA